MSDIYDPEGWNYSDLYTFKFLFIHSDKDVGVHPCLAFALCE